MEIKSPWFCEVKDLGFALYPKYFFLFGLFFGIDSKKINRFQYSFATTYINECNNNFVFVCKNHYVASLFKVVQLRIV